MIKDKDQYHQIKNHWSKDKFINKEIYSNKDKTVFMKKWQTVQDSLSLININSSGVQHKKTNIICLNLLIVT